MRNYSQGKDLRRWTLLQGYIPMELRPKILSQQNSFTPEYYCHCPCHLLFLLAVISLHSCSVFRYLFKWYFHWKVFPTPHLHQTKPSSVYFQSICCHCAPLLVNHLLSHPSLAQTEILLFMAYSWHLMFDEQVNESVNEGRLYNPFLQPMQDGDSRPN